MNFLRQRLPRFAAFVLLVWLCATGVAFAHACQSTIDLECVECCAEMKAAGTWTETRTVTVPAASPVLPPPVVVAELHPGWPPAQAAAPVPDTGPHPGGGQRIPIFFLRLAL